MAATVKTDQRGFLLVETMIALGILAIVAAGVMPLVLTAAKTTENQGHLGTRTTGYAQDKLEQLQALVYSDAATDTRVFPAAAAGGSGLTVGGSLNTAAPSALYVDYLDVNGNLLAAGGGGGVPANWYYIRVWRVVQFRPFVKRITVVSQVRNSVFGNASPMRSTVTVLKSDLF